MNNEEVTVLNKPLMKAIIAKNNDTQGELARALNLPQSAVSHRINGSIDFRLSEINCIRKRYNLTAEETVEIFFDQQVS